MNRIKKWLEDRFMYLILFFIVIPLGIMFLKRHFKNISLEENSAVKTDSIKLFCCGVMQPFAIINLSHFR